MAEYTSAYTGAEIDANLAKAATATQPADVATTISLAASAMQPSYTGDFTLTGNESISGNLSFTGTGNIISGDFSNATILNKTYFKTSTTNGATSLTAIPNGSSTVSAFQLYSSSDPTNASFNTLRIAAGAAEIRTGQAGTGVFPTLSLLVDNTTAIRITSSGTSTAGNNPLVLIRATSTTDTVTPLQVTGAIKHSAYAVASLPAGTQGCRAFVTDSNATLAAGHGNIVAAGGANFCPVYHDGTNWRIG